MRHLSHEVGLLTHLVVDSSSGCSLVSLAGRYKGLQPGLRRAIWTVDVAPVTSRADAYLYMASGTVVEPVGLMTRRRLKSSRQ